MSPIRAPRPTAKRTARIAVTTIALAAIGSTAAHAQGFTRYLTGNPADQATAQPAGGLLLAGGSTDVDPAMTWFKNRADGGDVVVLRASGSDGYNDYLFSELPGTPIDSVETFVFTNRAAAAHPDVLASVQNAEAIFFAGGDQSRYDDYWRGTPLEDAIHQSVRGGAVVGGTSAGLAILGSSAYTAQRRSLTSDDALDNPFDRDVTLEHDFLQLPQMQGVLTDSHFTQRDRQGRLLTMLARSADDTNTPVGFRGIGVNDQTAVAVEPNGTATVYANGNNQRAAHLFTLTQPATTLQPNTPLTLQNVAALEVRPGESFDFLTFTAAPGVGRPYSYQVNQGNLIQGPAIDPPAVLPGDFNASGTVEQSDLDLVLAWWGQSLLTPDDGNPPAANWTQQRPITPVGQTELDRVLTHWGQSTAPDFGNQPVPEPAAALLLIAVPLLSQRAR